MILKEPGQSEQTKHLFQNAEILSTHAAMDSTTWRLGLLDSIEDQDCQNAIIKLSRNAILPNVFYNIPILKAAAKNLTNNKLQYLILTKQQGNQETLKVFMPVTLSSIALLKYKVLASWTHDYAPVGMPLISNNNDHEILPAFIECVRTLKHDHAKAIVIHFLSKEGSFINGLYKSKVLSDRLLLATSISRAGLKPTKNLDYIATHFSGKRKQRLRKAKNELAALGELSFIKNSKLDTITTALEDFLTLEASGWKGKQKTALKSNIKLEAFCKDAIYNMAQEKSCHIHSIKLNGKTIASLITFEENGYFYPWKIAYDETHAKYSVGNLLAVHATTEFANSKNFRGLDSLAAEYNETTHHLWPDEKEFFTMIIGLNENAGKTALTITNRLNRLKRIKTNLREILNL